MSKKTYPFKAWVLTPSFAPKEVELIMESGYYDYHVTAKRKHYHESELFESKEKAIEHGWRRLDEQWSVLQKRADTITKKKVTLTKHAKDL